jgi:hypothetical protein
MLNVGPRDADVFTMRFVHYLSADEVRVLCECCASVRSIVHLQDMSDSARIYKCSSSVFQLYQRHNEDVTILRSSI